MDGHRDNEVESPDPAAVEALRVHRWRFDQLVRAGYRDHEASEMARNPAVDLEFARRLVLHLGCPPALAARILR